MSRPPLSPGSHKGAAVLFLIPSHLANELFPFLETVEPRRHQNAHALTTSRTIPTA